MIVRNKRFINVIQQIIVNVEYIFYCKKFLNEFEFHIDNMHVLSFNHTTTKIINIKN